MTMFTAVTHNIHVSVNTFYQEDYSYPMSQHFMFSYKIKIENKGNDTIQLLRRHWYIVDAFGLQREVEGEGVIGEQPIIRSNKSYSYISGCDLKTEVGKMFGTYLMENLNNGNLFYVLIPEFLMVAPMRLN
ncbi:MAG: Co2+/Mg2+ efflux protein ApaG [Chitinophagales bacterium]